MIYMIFMIFIFCSLKRTFHAFGVKNKFCRNLRNFQFHQDAVNTEVYSVFKQFSQKMRYCWKIVGKKSVFTLNIH